MTREAPSYGTPNEALKGAVQWIELLCETADIDPADSNFVVRARSPEGEVLKEIEINLADSISAFKRVIALYEPVVYHVDAAEGEEHENSRGEAE